ncbi:MAG: GNAT family N-acetyltransferase [Pirellulales bacterium]
MQTWTAVEHCVQGYCRLRSVLRPSQVIRRGPLLGLEELPTNKPERKRREFFCRPSHAPAAIAELDAFLPRSRQVLSIPVTSDAAAATIAEACKQAGYRLASSEYLFAHEGPPPPEPDGPNQIVLVTTEDLAARVAKAQGRVRITTPEYLASERSPLRLYCALRQGNPVAWAQSLAAGRGTRYVANLYTVRSHRRQGLATAVMSRLLQDDARLGERQSVLFSSHGGRGLYESLGYRQLGRLLMFWGKND